MGRTYEEERTFAHPKTTVFDAAQRAIPTIKRMRVKQADAASGRLVVTKGMTLKSWGEDVSIVVEDDGPDGSRVRVASRVKAQLMDWGTNRQNVESVLDAIALQLGG
ncbi:MAG TPA: hypothetical protein VG709_07155 [Actinomycetota bacterium]|nr:hypothetical protein [Actinomycetota bacterium]